jgi:HK97 gp10 family phage protein
MAGQRETSLLDVEADDFLKGLEAAFADLQIKTEQGLEAIAIKVVNRAKAFCPVATGRLRSSITAGAVEHDDQGPYVDVGVGLDALNSGVQAAQNSIYVRVSAGKRVSRKLVGKAQSTHVNYAPFVEFGTSKMAAQPFLRPALAEVAGYAGTTIAGQGGRKPRKKS